jgi:hypothetical protein
MLYWYSKYSFKLHSLFKKNGHNNALQSLENVLLSKLSAKSTTICQGIAELI